MTLTTDTAAGRTAPAAPAGGVPPRLADGVELIGEYEGSGYKEPPSLVRRGDGQVVQLTPLLYALVSHADGRRSHEELAAEAGEELPDREAMSLINTNIAAPVNVAAALNVASDNSIAYADATQTAPIDQSI